MSTEKPDGKTQVPEPVESSDLSFLSRERAEIWRWCGAATKNWVELNSAAGGRTCLDFPQRFCVSSRPVPRTIVGGQGERGFRAQRSGAVRRISSENFRSRAEGCPGVVRKKNA